MLHQKAKMRFSISYLQIAIFCKTAVAQGFGPESLDLLNFSGLQSSKSGYLTSDSGVDYNLSDLQPYTAIFAEDSFSIADDKRTATHKRTGQTFDISTFRASYVDGTIVQAAIDNNGKMSYAEIREGSEDALDTFFIGSGMQSANALDGNEGSDDDFMLAFNSSSIDGEKLSKEVDLGDAPPITGDTRLLLNFNKAKQSQYMHRRSQASACESLRVIKVAIVYDTELCGYYGGRSRTVDRLLTIVSSASAIYERDLCIKLELTDVLSPDNTCGGVSRVFGGFDFENPCTGQLSMLGSFTAWSQTARGSQGIDSNALIHFFTGVPRPTTNRVVGCAWLGVYCVPRWATGIEYITFSNNVVAQTIGYAHELGHNLNAPHLSDPQNRFNYIMEASLSSGSDGFSDESVRQMYGYLDSRDVTCDSSIPGPQARPPPTHRPTPAPVRRTRQPVVVPAPVRPTSQQPVLVPLRNPVPKPAQQPMRSPSSPECPKDEPVCVEEIDKSDRFACFSYSELVPNDCDGVHYALTKCDNKKVSRNLQEDGCQASCILLKNLVCLNGSTGSHELEFAGFDSQNRATGDTYIKKIPVSNNQNCAQPKAKCNA